MRRSLPAFIGAVLLAGCSVSGSGPAAKDSSESLVTVTSMTAFGTTQSLIQSNVSSTTSEVADVTFQNITKSAAITSPTPFFFVTLTRYRVVFSRGDGGPAPAPFEAGMSVFVPPPSVDAEGKVTGNTATTGIVIVPASLKGVSPLADLGDGGSFSANATVTFEGADGLGRSLSTTGGIAVVFRRQ